ncbi:ArnT family glycosyltransferase, partial [Halobacterium salinarum]|uniref:ArnT family glycosyltransferase n=1 Tax=Halobacterium salinarum TaxID=2242 RepID=UPI0025531325
MENSQGDRKSIINILQADSPIVYYKGVQVLSRLSRADYTLLLLLSVTGIWYTTSIHEGGLWGDEVYYAISAISIFSGNPYVNVVHMFAPVAKYIIGIGQLFFGITSFGSRIGIVLTAVLTLGIIYLIAEELDHPWTGVLAALSIAVTPLFATQ